MKRSIAAAALLLGTAFTAHADTDVYVATGTHPNSDLNQAFTLCEDDWGLVLDGTPASWEFKRCMLEYGWKYVRTEREGRRRR